MKDTIDSSKIVLRAELSTRIREALQLRDWGQLEHWARQWIAVDPKNPNGFKWLARASIAQNRLKKAAYAYGRLLDFDADNSEARRFFANYPSTLQEQPESVRRSMKTPGAEDEEKKTGVLLTPEQRKLLGQTELDLADMYNRFRLFAEAGEAYQRSHSWQPSQLSALGTARALHAQHRGLEAVKFLRQQLFHFTDWHEGRVLLGRILFDLGHVSEAQKEWQLVLKQNGEHREALDLIRSCL